MKSNLLKMSESELVGRLESRAHKADEIIQFLRNEVSINKYHKIYLLYV